MRILSVWSADREQQRSEFMVEQIGRNSAAIRPVLAKTKIVLRVVRNLLRQAELVAQPHVPIDVVLTVRARTRGGVDCVAHAVERADPRVPVVTPLRPGDLADAARMDRVARLP